MGEHKKQWEFLVGKYTAGQLGHAYLFSGPDGIGKKMLAKELIKLINKSVANSVALIDKEQYPDLLVVKSINSESSQKNEKDMMEIDVDQIRQVNTFLSYKSYYDGYKAVLVEDADRMNTEAQNSFLKTLEEPKGKTLIILLSSKPDALLSTIFSRCQTISFFPFEKQAASTGDQVMLRELLQILPAELATKFAYTKKANLEGDRLQTILQILQRYFRNLLLIQIGATKEPMPAQFVNYSVQKLQQIIRLIEKLNKQTSQTNANAKMALEVLLLEL